VKGEDIARASVPELDPQVVMLCSNLRGYLMMQIGLIPMLLWGLVVGVNAQTIKEVKSSEAYIYCGLVGATWSSERVQRFVRGVAK